MWKFCSKNRGAISVFLTLILIPTFIFSGVLVDGSRILGAKNLVSGAGELAMNGALSNYSEELNEVYGLLAMATTAEEVESAMQAFFETTLNYSGLNKGDVTKALVYLELIDDSFAVSNIPGSEIFRTDVLKQEILEYMKYRAPVTAYNRIFGDEDALEQLGNVEKEKNAADGQLQFERKLDGLQKLFDAIKDKAAKLHDYIWRGIYNKAQFDSMLIDAEASYEEITMLAAALHCMQNDAANATKGGDILGLMKEMVGLQWSGDIDAENASKIIRMIVINNSVDDPDAILDGVPWGSEEYRERQELMEEYAAAQENMADGIRRTEERLDSLVKNVYDDVYEQYELAKEGLKTCDEIDELLDDLVEAFEKLHDAYDNWKDAVEELPNDARSKAGYEENLEENSFFETEGMIPEFRQLIEDNRTYFTEVCSQLDELTFAGTPLHEISNKKPIMAEADCDFIQYANEITTAGRSLMGLYNDIGSMNLSIDKESINLEGNTFIKMLQEKYCKIENADPAAQQAKTEEWDGKMNEKSNLLDKLFSTDIDFNLTQYSLPSDWIENGKGSVPDSNASSDLEDFDGTVSETTIDGGLDENKRESAYDSGSQNLNKDNGRISDISGLPELLSQAAAEVVEPLIITEYVMGMFSHYTSNYVGYQNKIEHPLSITDDDLSEHAVYRAEIEYILWGRPEARDNVTITKSIIFAVNLIFNLSFAFTDSRIKSEATQIAALFPVGALAKIAIKCALQTMVAMIETVRNMEILLEGGAVPLVKHLGPTWETYILPSATDTSVYDGETGFTYEDYVWIMLCVKMFIPSYQEAMLERTADCIELNMTKRNSSNSLKNMYTMVDLEATVSIDTFFLPKLNGAGYNVQAIDENTFTIDYYGVQGY